MRSLMQILVHLFHFRHTECSSDVPQCIRDMWGLFVAFPNVSPNALNSQVELPTSRTFTTKTYIKTFMPLRPKALNDSSRGSIWARAILIKPPASSTNCGQQL
uniref:Bm14406 n=1 Tax=Brugia malayi TaxID=6279 RepID=A0A1I9G301_BRUMA|nr:Bm14406 [Brugia malayi]